MTKNNTGLLAFRILSVYVVIHGLIITAKFIHKWPAGWPEQDRLLWQAIMFSQIFGPLVLLAIFAAILWRLAPQLTMNIFAEDNQLTDSANKTISIIALVVSCIGLYLLIDALSQLIKTLISIYASLKYISDAAEKKEVNIYILTTILKFAVGFGLLLRGKKLVTVLHKQRNE